MNNCTNFKEVFIYYNYPKTFLFHIFINQVLAIWLYLVFCVGFYRIIAKVDDETASLLRLESTDVVKGF